jgi:hypothetical protein
VSMYVGPLDDGPDPLCVVEADIAAGVRSIRLSELNALHVRVLRPVGLTDRDRCRLADWVVGRIGSEYDLPHAWTLLRHMLRLRLPDRFRAAPGAMASSATRFICCSLLAHAFAWVGYPILLDQTRGSYRDGRPGPPHSKRFRARVDLRGRRRRLTMVPIPSHVEGIWCAPDGSIVRIRPIAARAARQ